MNIEDIPYLKIRKYPPDYFHNRMEEYSKDIDACPADDPELKKSLQEQRLFCYLNLDKPWGVCFADGEDYVHFCTFMEMMDFMQKKYDS